LGGGNSFSDITQLLKSLGVNSMLIGWEYTDFEDDMFGKAEKRPGVFRIHDPNFIPYDSVEDIYGIFGCAGSFALEMAACGLEVAISKATFPSSRPG